MEVLPRRSKEKTRWSPNKMDALEWLRKHLEGDRSDLLREMVATFAERLMAAEVDVVCSAGYGDCRAHQ